ncbi:MAG: dNTP triphosphohydrolase [Bacteroidaceae bacterium]|nr:dNTP triphosphohydrolase [Bacteroidaceae bacterium]
MDIRLKKLFNNERLRKTSVTREERAHYHDERNDYESDLGRALFSSAARRLHDKTQVFPLTNDDNIHSRLTHSMEVMNIGASLAKDICFNESFRNKYNIEDVYEIYEPLRAILQTVCLVHDIGNPPFGHFGEQTICDYFKRLFKAKPEILDEYRDWEQDFTHYDGNAQGFRVITKLQFIDDLYGLNFTKSCLASYLKYPNTGKGDSKSKFISHHKHGVFCADKKYLDETMKEHHILDEMSYKRHPFVFLVEAADSICYLSMDLEDAYNKGWFTTQELYNRWIKGFDKECDDTATKLFNILSIAGGATGSAGRKGFIRFRIEIIKYLVAKAVDNYLKNFEAILEGEYNKELIFDDNNNVALFLKEYCINNIYNKKEIQSVELTGWSVINGLLDIYIKLLTGDKVYMRHGEAMISQAILRANKMDYMIHNNKIEWSPQERAYIKKEDGKRIDDVDILCDSFPIENLPYYYRFRIIVDFISSMTDKFAVTHYQKLSGQRI